MSLHELIQFLDGDTFWMLTHQAENQFDGTILLGEFSTVRHDCSFSPPFFSRYLRRGTRGLKLVPGLYWLRIGGPVAQTRPISNNSQQSSKSKYCQFGALLPANRNGSFHIPRKEYTTVVSKAFQKRLKPFVDMEPAETFRFLQPV